MSDDIRNNIVKSSRGEIYKLYIKGKALILEKYSGKGKMEKNILLEDVLDYSLDMDENDKIHIIYVNNKRELNYTNYPQDVQGINILKVNDNCMIDSLKVKFVQSRLNIFYRVNDMYKNTSYICHNYIYDLKWIDEIILPKYMVPYFIDNNKHYIYILYCKSIYANEYRIKKFNIAKGLWEELEEKIIVEDAMNLDFFITPNNIGIICFNKIINNNSHTLVKYKDFNIENSHWSSSINISSMNVNTFKPISFFKNDTTYIMWKQGRDILYRKSKDMLKWSKEYSVNLNDESLGKCLLINKSVNDCNSKINQIFLSAEINSYPYVKTESTKFYNNENINDYSINNYVLDEASIDLNDSQQREPDWRNIKKGSDGKTLAYLNNIVIHLLKEFKQEKEKLRVNLNEKNQDIQELLTKLESQNKTIRSFKEINLNLKNQIDHINNSLKDNEVLEETHKLEFKNLIELKDKEFNSINETNLELKKEMECLNNSINDYKEKLVLLRNEKDTSDQGYLQNIENYKNEIAKLEEEKNLLLITNKKIEDEISKKIKENETLTQNCEEKDNIIQKYKDKIKNFIEGKNKEFKVLNEENSYFKNKIGILEEALNNINDKIQSLRAEKIFEEDKYNNKINDYENQIRELKEKNEEIVININNKIASLVRIIDEKEIMMEKLRIMLETNASVD